MQQTQLFESESESNRTQQRWVDLGEETQQEIVTLLVQLMMAMQSSETEESDDDRDGQ